MSATCLCERETAIRRPVPPTAESSHKEVLAFLHYRNAARTVPRPICRDCRYPFNPQERSKLYRHLCDTCGVRRIDRIVHRLIRQMGRRKAIKALRKLTK